MIYEAWIPCAREGISIRYGDNDSASGLVRNCRHGSGIWRSHRFVVLRGKAFDTRMDAKKRS